MCSTCNIAAPGSVLAFSWRKKATSLSDFTFAPCHCLKATPLPMAFKRWLAAAVFVLG